MTPRGGGREFRLYKRSSHTADSDDPYADEQQRREQAAAKRRNRIARAPGGSAFLDRMDRISRGESPDG